MHAERLTNSGICIQQNQSEGMYFFEESVQMG